MKDPRKLSKKDIMKLFQLNMEGESIKSAIDNKEDMRIINLRLERLRKEHDKIFTTRVERLRITERLHILLDNLDKLYWKVIFKVWR